MVVTRHEICLKTNLLRMINFLFFLQTSALRSRRLRILNFFYSSIVILFRMKIRNIFYLGILISLRLIINFLFIIRFFISNHSLTSKYPTRQMCWFPFYFIIREIWIFICISIKKLMRRNNANRPNTSNAFTTIFLISIQYFVNTKHVMFAVWLSNKRWFNLTQVLGGNYRCLLDLHTLYNKIENKVTN